MLQQFISCNSHKNKSHTKTDWFVVVTVNILKTRTVCPYLSAQIHRINTECHVFQVGLLSVYYPIVNFQEKTKNAKKKLLKLVQERLGEGEDAETLKAQKDQANERHKNLSFQVCLHFYCFCLR